MKTTVKIQDEREDAPRFGAVDGGHHYLSCSNCDAVLVDLLVTHPGETDFSWSVKAGNCPFCDEDPKTAPLGGSYVHPVKGLFVCGGYGEVRDDSPIDDTASTFIDESYVDDNDVHVFIVRKAGPNARPIKKRP